MEQRYRKAKSSDDETTSDPAKPAPPKTAAIASPRVAAKSSELNMAGCILVISCVCCGLAVLAAVFGYVYLERSVAVLKSSVQLYETQQNVLRPDSALSTKYAMEGANCNDIFSPNRHKPIVWIVANNIGSGYLDHVIRVFEQFGWSVVTEQNASRVPDFDVIWSHEYPFANETFMQWLQKLKVPQRVNHIPNSALFTNKLTLSNTGFKFTPKSFRLPADNAALLNYSRENPQKRFLRKGEEHRNVQFIGSHDELSTFLQSAPQRTFVQEYIEPVSLVGGRKYDLGIYTLITSVRPLRVFTWDAEIGFRFCAKPYKPNDFSDPDAYVIADDYGPIWTIPELQEFYTDNSYTNKDTFMSYLRRAGHANASDIVENIVKSCKRIIAETLLFREPDFIAMMTGYKSAKHFFELVRFDFMVDANFQVYLLEANMSPNLGSGHFRQNERVFEQVLFNMFTVLGFNNDKFWSIDNLSWVNMEMQVTLRDIAVYHDFCNGDQGVNCKASCDAHFLCRLCTYCMTTRWKIELKQAYIEYRRRYNFGLAYPPILAYEEAKAWSFENPIANGINITAQDEWDMVEFLWFRGKCLADRRWCAP